MIPFQRTALAVLTSFSWFIGSPARADDSYYLIVFGQQDRANRVEASHTFATFAKVTADRKVETHTISWMPKSMRVSVLAGPEAGVNLSLKESLVAAPAVNAEISMWGPYRVKPELYELAGRQVARLQRGDIAYKAVDVRFRPDRASNCIHAVADLDREQGQLLTGAARGNEASQMVLKHLERWIVAPDDRGDWLVEQLGLKSYGKSASRPSKLETQRANGIDR